MFKKLIVVATVATALLGTEIALAGPADNANTRAVVEFAGDSNIVLSSNAITLNTAAGAHQDNGYVPVIASRIGSTIRTPDCLDPTGCTTNDYWKLKLAGLADRIQPDAVVTDLGINDTVSAGTAVTTGYLSYGQKIDWFMALIPRTTPVFWTNLPCAIEPPARLTGCQQVNVGLVHAVTRWPNLVLVDWSKVANTHPEYISPVDGIHLTAAGSAAWASLVTSALDVGIP